MRASSPRPGGRSGRVEETGWQDLRTEEERRADFLALPYARELVRRDGEIIIPQFLSQLTASEWNTYNLSVVFLRKCRLWFPYEVEGAFYPGHRFATWTVAGARRLDLAPAGGAGGVDAALDLAARNGLAYLRLPDSPVLVADPRTVDVVATTVERLMLRSPRLADERTGGVATALSPDRVAVAVSHNDQKDHVRIALAERGLERVRVDTANKLQGLEVDVLVAWHPLAGLPTPDGFHLDPGRLCVMLTRHRHALIVVGRVGDAALLGDVPPLGDAWLGVDAEPDVAGWFAHRQVFDTLRNFVVDLS